MAVLRKLKRGLVLIFCVSLAIFLLHTWNTEGKVWAFVIVCFTFNFSLFILWGACFLFVVVVVVVVVVGFTPKGRILPCQQTILPVFWKFVLNYG